MRNFRHNQAFVRAVLASAAVFAGVAGVLGGCGGSDTAAVPTADASADGSTDTFDAQTDVAPDAVDAQDAADAIDSPEDAPDATDAADADAAADTALGDAADALTDATDAPDATDSAEAEVSVGSFAIALSSATPTRASSASFTVTDCGNATHVLVNAGATPTAGDAGWTACSTTASAIHGSLLGGMNVLHVWVKLPGGAIQSAGGPFTVVRNNMFALGDGYSCALVAGHVYCWGDNTYGELGNGSTSAFSAAPVTVTGLDSGVLEIAGGPHAMHACALKDDGSVVCWGANDAGQLGDPAVTSKCGTTNQRACSRTPVVVQSASGGALSSASAVIAGSSHACALLTAGQLACWGDATFGQGMTGAETASLPKATVSVTFSPARTRLYAGSYLTCAESTTDLLCAGLDYTNTPPATYGPQTAVIGGAGDHACANGYICVSTPAMPQVLTTSVPAVFSIGYRHICSVSGGGIVKCWGDNTLAQYGNGGTTSSAAGAAPTLTGTFDYVAAGAHHSCARNGADGTVSCWGLNDFAQVGGTSTGTCIGLPCSTTPVKVAGISGVASIAAGRKQTCAAASGKVWCWGADDTYELGSIPTSACTSGAATVPCSYEPLAVPGLGGS